MKTRLLNNVLPLLLSLMLAVGLAGCAGPEKRKSVSVMDSPEHHVFSGNKLLDKEDYEGAKREFNLALQLNPDFSPAHVGKGLVLAFNGDFENAHESMEDAVKNAEKKEHVVNAHVGLIRLHSLERSEGWLKNAEEAFNTAIETDKNAASPYYYMGLAYKVTQTMAGVSKAGGMFQKVLNLNSDFIVESNKEWALVQKIQRAAPGSKIGLAIALINKIDRADIAALFVQELLLEKLFKKRGVKTFDTGFKAPEDSRKFKADSIATAPEVTDIDSHVLRTDIETIIALQIRGLEPYPDHTFKADELLTRVEYAVMVEDILIKVTGDQTLASKFVGREPSFPDVRSDQWFFNAIELASSRGIMSAVDLSSGEFKPQEHVSGADALLIVRKLKDELKFF